MLRGTITSHWEQSQRTASLGSRETEIVRCRVSVVASFAGGASQLERRV